MLTAILHGKAGRVEIDDQVLSWREVFREREDLLTSVFFGRLRYLSDETQARVLTLLIGQELSDSLGLLQEIEFWPRLKGVEGRQYVEPDVILHYLDHMLLVEVKPPFGGSQNKDQWLQEVQALNLHNNDEKSIILLALGRNVPTWREAAGALEKEFEDIGLRVATQEWQALSDGLRSFAGVDDPRDDRIIEDWLGAFSLFGLTERVLPFSRLLACCMPTLPGAGLALLERWTAPSRIEVSHREADWEPLVSLAKTLKKESMPWASLKKML
jgi:hypothetical protein